MLLINRDNFLTLLKNIKLIFFNILKKIKKNITQFYQFFILKYVI